MARKRLSLSSPFAPLPEGPGPADTPLETKSALPPPIARVAAEAASSAALDEMATAWEEARTNGRLVQALPLEAIEEFWLQRDRLTLDPEDLNDLVASIRERGQQVPIEVVALEDGSFGLISGWRRLRALKHLAGEPDGARFGQVLALLRRPASPAEAYRAMVEENEVRAGLSYYERANVAARAAAVGVFPDPRAAIRTLFVTGSKAKRSKIASFLTLVQALGDRLRFGPAIPERLGLQLARALDEVPGLRETLRERLRKGAPGSADEEMALLERGLAFADRLARRDADADDASPQAPPAPRRREVVPGLWLQTGGPGDKARLTLTGSGVDAALEADLVAWLQGRT